MGSDPGQIYCGRFHEFVVDTTTVTMLGNVALGRLKAFQEVLLNIVTEDFLRQLNRPPSILNDLHRFNAG